MRSLSETLSKRGIVTANSFLRELAGLQKERGEKERCHFHKSSRDYVWKENGKCIFLVKIEMIWGALAMSYI